MTALEPLRYSLTVQYDGSAFRGWQLQSEGRTVQGELERVVRTLTGIRRTITGSGRTDAGVHALGQVVSLEVPGSWSAKELRRSINALLPSEIWVSEARRVPPDFHPRHHAMARSYEYRVGTEPEAASPFFRPWCWNASHDPPDPELLVRTARMIPGDRSFRRFAKAGQPHRGERCRVTKADWSPWTGPGLRFVVTSNRYLHHMIRYLVGTMVDVARGRRPIEEMEELLNRPDSPLVTSPPAPPEGLFLSRVEYPPERLGDHPDRDPASLDEAT